MLSRLRQIAARLETLSGTAAVLSGGDAKILGRNPKINFDVEMFTRNVALSSFSKKGKIAGKRPGSFGFELDLAGSGTATTAPEWSKFMKACGFSENTLKSITIGAVATGPFLHGEVITAAGGGTGRVIKNTANGTTTLYFVLLTGSIGAEGLTGGTSGATATASTTASDAGIVWLPISENAPCLTIGSYEHQVRKLLKGSRGKVKFTAKGGEPMIAGLEFMGVEAGTTDLAQLTVAFGTQQVPPTFMGATFTIGGTTLKISEFEIGLDSTLTGRDDVTDARSLHSFQITDRTIVGSFDPEMETVATHDFFGKWYAGTEAELNVAWGSTTGNKFEMYAPKLQYDKVEDGDRGGLMTAKTSFVANANSESLGNSEFCLIQL